MSTSSTSTPTRGAPQFSSSAHSTTTTGTSSAAATANNSVPPNASISASPIKSGHSQSLERRPSRLQKAEASNGPATSPTLGAANTSAAPSNSAMETRIVTLERTCSKLVSLLGTTSVASVSGSVERLERKLAAQESAMRLQWEQHTSTAIDACNQQWQMRLQRAEQKIAAQDAQLSEYRELLHATQKQFHASSSSSSSSSTSAPSSSSSAANLVDQRLQLLEQSIQTESARQCSDLDALIGTLQIQFARTYDRVTNEQSARLTFEENFKKFILKFQQEFRAIVSSLQTNWKTNHKELEKIIRAEIEARVDGERATSSSVDHKIAAFSKEVASTRADFQKSQAELNSRLGKSIEQARAAISHATSALSKVDVAVSDAATAKDIAQRAAARIGAASSTSSSAAAPTHQKSASSSVLPTVSVAPQSLPPPQAKKPQPSPSKDKEPSKQQQSAASQMPPAKLASPTAQKQPSATSTTKQPLSPAPTSAPTLKESPKLSPTSSSNAEIDGSRDEEWAALKIQKVFRGFGARRDIAIQKISSMMPLCEKCKEKSSVKRCLDCSLTVCQHCEQELHRNTAMKHHKRHYLLNEYKQRSQVLQQSMVILDSNESQQLDAKDSKVSTATAAPADPNQFVGPASPFKNGDLFFSALENLANAQTFDPVKGQVVSISVGLNHCAALTANGIVFMWGLNECGQLGTGDRVSKSQPTPIALSKIVQVACGHEHTIARSSDGLAYSWGSGMLGRLGLRTDEDQEVPQQVSKFPANTKIVFIAAGQYNSGFIAAPVASSSAPTPAANQLYICGTNEEGECAIGNRIPQLVPHAVSVPSGVSFTRVAFGDKHGVAISSAGEVWSWGSCEFGQGGKSVSTPKSAFQLTPQLVDSLKTLKQFAVEVACGERHTHILTRDGKVWSFGSGESHQIGIMDNVDQFAPVWVEALQGKIITQIATGSAVSYAITDNGDCYGWGYGLETPIPQLQESLRGQYIQTIGVGSNDNLAFLTGVAQEIFQYEFEVDSEPKVFESLRGKRLKQVAVGSTHYCFVDGGGRLLVSGANNDYQLGTGNNVDMIGLTVSISLPVQIQMVSASAMHSVALATDGTVWSWGSSMSGRCGTGSDGDIARPTLLESIKSVPMKYVTASQYNSGSISATGAVYAWGSGDGGQIGIKGFQPQLKPVQVPINDPVTKFPLKAVSLAFGNKHGVAVGESGMAVSWGNNEFGQLGIGSSDSPGAVGDDGNPLQHLPIAVALLSKVPLASAYCGENCTFFLTREGALYSCGSGETAQLGVGPNAEDQPFPTKIQAFADAGAKIATISIGNLNCVALTDKGQVWAWGWALGEEPAQMEFYKDKQIKYVISVTHKLTLATYSWYH